MRGLVILTALTVAGCGEHRGVNPNYQFGSDRYGQYLTAREAALITGADPVQVIPVARPFYAPTAVQIAGQDPVLPPPTMGIRRTVATAPAAAPAPAASAATP